VTITADELKQIIVEHFDADLGDVQADTSLFNGGLLDSFHLLELVRYLESRVGIKISPLELTLENFDTVERILKFLSAKSA